MSVLLPSWGRSSPAARPAFLAAYVELVIGLVVFVIALVGATVSLGQSPSSAIFGPAQGMPLIVWVMFMSVVVVIQLAIALALRPRLAWLRVIGTIAAGALAFCGIAWIVGWLIWIPLSLGTYLERGGDRADLVGVLISAPLILALGFLNGRAALRTIAELRGR